MSVKTRPLVSVGVPVRNGSQGLGRALSSLVDQTYPNLEIIISDNCSVDDTESISRRFVDRDPRITYVRQEVPLTAVQNFRFTFERSHGDYFMWAAHDDWRSDNYVETLLRGFARAPNGSVVFSRAWFSRNPDLSVREPYLMRWDSAGQGFWEKLRSQADRVTVNFYGLINPLHLRDYPWFPITNSPDVPLLHWLLCHGDFVYEDGADFVYYNPGKTYAESIRDVEAANAASVDPSDRFAAEQLAWTTAGSVCEAERLMGRRRSQVAVFCGIYVWRSHGLRNALYRWTPTPLRRAWAAAKAALVGRRKSEAH